MDPFFFLIGSTLVVVGSFTTIVAKHIFHAALGLAVALAGTAGLFIPLGGELISVVQILVYLGAVAIAIIFMLMLSPPYYLQRKKRHKLKIAGAALITLLFTGALGTVILGIDVQQVMPTLKLDPLHEIGRLMLSDYVFPFEIISLVLTVVIIAAISLARELPKSDESDAESAAILQTPLKKEVVK